MNFFKKLFGQNTETKIESQSDFFHSHINQIKFPDRTDAIIRHTNAIEKGLACHDLTPFGLGCVQSIISYKALPFSLSSV